MNPFLQALISIPLTPGLIIITSISIITIFATEQHALHFIIVGYIAILGYTLFKNHIPFILLTMLSLITSLCMIARINHQYNNYKSDLSFFKTAATVEGFIEQINHATIVKDQTTVIINTTYIQNKRKKLTLPKKIAVFFPTTVATALQEHQRIKIYYLKLEQPEQGSDYQRYLIKEGFWAVARAGWYAKYDILETRQPISQTILSSFYQKLPEASLSLFDPLFLGKREKNKHNLIIQHNSMYWGICHHMARSGIHLAILFTLIMLLLHYTQIPYLYRYLLCIGLLLGYAIISQASISFLRALYMILFHILAKLCKQLPSSLHTLTLTTLITLMHNPMQLFFLDFQLSFGITYIIIWLFTIKSAQTVAFYKQRLVRF